MGTPKRIHELDPKNGFDKSFEIEVDKSGESESQKQTLEVITGDRQFTEENYVTSDETPTVSIDKLDKQTKINSDAIVSLDNRFSNIEIGNLLSKPVTISQAEILSMNTAPKELFALPTTETIRLIHDIVGRIKFNTTAFNSEDNRILIGFLGEPAFAEMSAEFLQSGITDWYRCSFLSNTKLKSNKKIVAWVENTNPENGDGYIELYISYQEFEVGEEII